MAMSMQSVGKPKMTPHDYEGFSKEGYAKNITVFRCVNIISRAGGGVPWMVKSKRSGKDFSEHPLLTLMNRPNPMQGQAKFMQNFLAYYTLTGNSYIEQTKLGNTPPLELYTPRPDRMRIVPGANGFPEKYIYKVGMKEVHYEVKVDGFNMMSNILHMKSFNPTDDWYGMSPIEPAMFSIDQQNEAGRYNIALIQNQARPSGVLVVEATDARPTGNLTDEQFKRLKSQLEENYSRNRAGKPMLLEGGLKWQQLSLTPQQMDFLENKNVTSRDIASAFGVPPLMLNIPGDSTYSNYKEARLALYEDTILPMLDDVRDELNNQIAPQFGDDIILDYDKDTIQALVEKRMEKFTTIEKSSVLTQNEKREELGWGTVPGMDVFVFGSSDRVVDKNEMDFTTVNAQSTPAMLNEPSPQQQQDEEPEEQEDNDMEDDDDETKSIAPPVEFKIFNLLNSVEQQKSARQQEVIRNKYQKEMEDELKKFSEFHLQKFVELAETINPDVLEFALLKYMDENYFTDFSDILEKYISKIAKKFGNEVMANAQKEFGEYEKKGRSRFNKWLDDFIKKRTAESISHIESADKKKVRRVVKRIIKDYLNPESETFIPAATRIRKSLGLTESRANLIARTETTIAANTSGLNAVKELEVPDMNKTWVSVNDDRTRDNPDVADHQHISERTIPINEKFLVNPDTLMESPGDPSAPGEQLFNCRCVLTYKRRKRD